MATLDRISGLLVKAERSDNEHERDAYMQMAQHLARTSGVELEVARQNTLGKEKRDRPSHHYFQIGERGQSGLRALLHLFVQIAEQNDITVDVYGSMSSVSAYGYESDLEYAKKLYNVLSVQMVDAANKYLDGADWRRDTAKKSQARRSFYQSYTERIAKRLSDANRQAERETNAKQYDVLGENGNIVQRSGELVLADKRHNVWTFYRENSDVTGLFDTGSPITSRRAAEAGDRAGQRARMGGEKEIGGSRPGIAAR
ncbi:MAG: DUF2786 domain-containing protein [Pseudonocardiaceae bacterium]|nr:DUF2786 domain-containing protein [Pseudonocardiaceae bacterium]